MSKPFNYSKWDNIELSDDEADVHPNIERESWFRMKHRSRVEREEREEVDKRRIREEISKANLRIEEIQRILQRQRKGGKGNEGADDDDEEDTEGLVVELEELQSANAQRQSKLNYYEKHKKWNVDNMCHVVAEKTVITSKTKTQSFNEQTGYALPDDEEKPEFDTKPLSKEENEQDNNTNVVPPNTSTMSSSKPKSHSNTSIKTETTAASKSKSQIASKPSSTTTYPSSTTIPAGPKKPSHETHDALTVSMMSYAQFTEKYEQILETFISIQSMDQTREYLIQHGNILLQENASSYILLACLEDEMNGKHDKMRLVARQSQILTNIAELAKTMKQHPGNVIQPFFSKMSQREHFTTFLQGVDAFIEKVKARAIVKRKEMDKEAASNGTQTQVEEDGDELVDLHSIPREQRLGPGGLDPVEVFESLPVEMQQAFESREVEQLKHALLQMDPKDAEYHMKRCIDCGLWNEGGGGSGDVNDEEEEKN
jgi:cell division cycle protein 37